MSYYRYEYSDFKITKREVLFSIAIIAVMLLIGFVIHGNINDALMLRYQEYNTALKIDNNAEMFAYGMRTNIGNAFVYGELYAVDPVSYPEVEGEYSKIKKVKEKYTQHFRTVTKTRTNADGEVETYTEIEEYWTWDEIDSWSQHSTKINFVGSEFDYGMIEFPSTSHIDTQYESRKIRYCYYGSPTSCVGTLYTVLKDNTINENRFYTMTIDETIEYFESSIELVIFWIVWIPLTGGLVYLFYYLDNNWLEDKKSIKNTNKRGNNYEYF